jgi:hypothetical protein
MRKLFQSRAFTAAISSLATATLVACLCLRGRAPATSAERMAKLEAELKSMQEEAAQNPARPTVAQMESELEALQAEAAKDPSRPTVAQMERELERLSRTGR